MSESRTRSFVTCCVDGLELGVDLERVREILLSTRSTHVCGARAGVDGLVNLRGELVTVLNLASILHGNPTKKNPNADSKKARTIIIECAEESIGLIVDRVGDVLVCQQDEVEPVPGNLQHSSEDRFFEGVVQSDERVFVILDLMATIEFAEPANASNSGAFTQSTVAATGS